MQKVSVRALEQHKEARLATLGGKYGGESGGVGTWVGASQEALAVCRQAVQLLYTELDGEYGGVDW